MEDSMIIRQFTKDIEMLTAKNKSFQKAIRSLKVKNVLLLGGVVLLGVVVWKLDEEMGALEDRIAVLEEGEDE